jgi:hypothetical protein
LLLEHQLLERAKVITDLVRPAVSEVFGAAQRKRTNAANKRQRNTTNLSVGTLVMLRDPTRSTKHQPIWMGPYRVVKQKKGGTYVLQNLDHSLYHREPPRDHLKVIEGNADLSVDDIFYVERILDHKGNGSQRRYLVKWLNFPASENTWEPTANLVGCESFLQEYWATRATGVLGGASTTRAARTRISS